MASLRGKSAIVIGASSGVGKATTRTLAAEGVRVTAVARNGDRLRALRDEAPEPVEIVQADAADPSLAARLLGEIRPDLVVLAAGVAPKMAPLDEQSWEEFSAPWNSDLQAAFHLLRSAISLPLRPGSTVVVVSSGAAINGSHLSGGYAGAKRMQWLLAGYAQKLSDGRKLGIRTLAVLPTQLIEGTTIAGAASSAYGASQGISGRDFMNRFDIPLDPQKVADAIAGALRGEVADGVTAIAVSGRGVEPIK
jgi:NAD(P)-dependent dehydrogenase (short-subunit alcohol dehydrogenase family)